MLTIYKASAGSGKTYTLTLEYIKLLLGIKDEKDGLYRLNMPKYNSGRRLVSRHRHILAITFTNKATEEMKSRIVKELALLADSHSDGTYDSEYASKLIASFGCTREELRECAAMALKEMLFDYHHFNVSTIDSFFQTVLRSFAREVDRQGDYAIEINDEYAVSSGIGLMLDDLNYGNPPRRRAMLQWISRYTMDIVERGQDGSMFNRTGSLIRRLTKYVRRMNSEVFKHSSNDVLHYLEDPGRIVAFMTAIRHHIADKYNNLKSQAASVECSRISLGIERQAIPTAIWRIIDAVNNSEPINPITAFSTIGIKKLLEWTTTADNSFYIKKYLPSGNAAKSVVYPPAAFSRDLSMLINACREAAVEIHALTIIVNACPNLEFLGFTWHYINRFRTENNLILLSDTNDLLQRIIGESSTPFIYERIGVTLNHFLIDEFQDTSHMQWHNLKPLVENSLDSDNDNLIIGDEKQAIYRFRNSDSSLLHHIVMEQDFPNNYRLQGNKSSENTNYRSAAGIVRFNNTVFDRIAHDKRLTGYENTIQSIAKSKREVSHLIRIYDTSETESVNDCPAELEITAQEIIRQHHAGYRWADIAVLVRYTAEAEAVVNYLLNNHPEINVLSDEALMLRNSPAVKLVVSILKLVDDSYSSLSSKHLNDTIGKAGYGSLADTRMMISRFEYFISEGHDVSQAISLALDDTPGTTSDNISDSIADIRSQHPSGLVSLVETIIEKKIPASRRRQEYAYLAAFQDEVIKYCANYNPSVHAFLGWWEEASQKLAINSDAATDAVSVMTVHKSKGLQWSCVHIPFGDWELVRANDTVWIKPDMLDFVAPETVPPLLAVEIDSKCALPGSPLYEAAIKSRDEQMVDNINTTYVAYTRPKRELIICFASQKKAGAEVLKSIQSQPSSSEEPDLCIDLAQFYNPSYARPSVIFEYGRETTPDTKDRDNFPMTFETVGDYRSYFRDDISKYVSIDDAYTRLDDNGTDKNTIPTEISDTLKQSAERGIILHAIMAEIDGIDDIDMAIKNVSARFCLSKEKADQYKLIIKNSFSESKKYTSRWFAPEATILKEQSIYIPNGDHTIRPDRIVFIGNTAEVVDYKFTAEPLDSHEEQVAGYVRVLMSMGYDNVKGYLWYPELNKIIEVKI